MGENSGGETRTVDEESSDLDTDSMLRNGTDVLTNAASVLMEQQRRTQNLLQSADKSPISEQRNKQLACNLESVRRSLDFDSLASKVSNISTSDQSHSCPSTPKSANKGCLKKFSPLVSKIASSMDSGIPSSLENESTDSHDKRRVAFYDPISYHLAGLSETIDQISGAELIVPTETTIVSEKQQQTLRSLLSNAKQELINAGNLIARSTIGAFGSTPSISLEESTFLDRLSLVELRELYEVEYYKRIHSEKKIDMLQRQLLDAEQKLAVASGVVDRYRSVVLNVERSCDEFLEDIAGRERERVRLCSGMSESNGQLKQTLERVLNYSQTVVEKNELLSTRVQSLERDLESRSDAATSLETKLSACTQASEGIRRENNVLRKKLEQAEQERKTSISHEEQLTKELLLLDRAVKEKMDTIQKLTSELNDERAARHAQASDMDYQYKHKMTEMRKELETRVEKAYQDADLRKSNELRKLKDEWETVMRGLNEKYTRVVNERDQALFRVKEYEDTFEERQRAMCFELQQRLYSKYHELLSAFNPSIDQAKGAGGNAQGGGGSYTAAESLEWMQTTMADEFLERLQEARPIETPRHYGYDAEKHDLARRGQSSAKQQSSTPGTQRPTNNTPKQK